jgi:hypothetical protein
MTDHESKAREIITAWQANPGMAGEPDLQTRIAQALSEARQDGIEVAASECEVPYLCADTARHFAGEIRALKHKNEGV